MDYSQGPELFAIIKLVIYKIHAPTLAQTRGVPFGRLSMCGLAVVFRTLTSLVKALPKLGPVHVLIVVHKAFPFQKDIDTHEPEANPHGGYLVYPHPRQSITAALGLVIKNTIVQ
jgi:hypothetical protein